MNLFRSEEHVERWIGDRAPGATIPVTTLAGLAHAWYRDRLVAGWRPRTIEQNQEILYEFGLSGPFWRLT